MYNESTVQVKFPSKLKPTFFPSHCYKQKGNNDCGVFMLLHANEILMNKSIKPKNFNILQQRRQIQKDLLKASEYMQESYLICGENVNLSGNSIRCSRCQRYMHDNEIDVDIQMLDLSKPFIARCAKREEFIVFF